MTITLKKNSVDVRVELRRNDSDFIGDDRAYYTYFFSKAGCFGSAKVTEKEVYPIDCESFTTKERENFKDALASLQPDILKLASFLNKENENKGDLESTLDLQWALAKRGRPSLDDKPLIRTTIMLTEEDKEKLKVLGGSGFATRSEWPESARSNKKATRRSLVIPGAGRNAGLKFYYLAA